MWRVPDRSPPSGEQTSAKNRYTYAQARLTGAALLGVWAQIARRSEQQLAAELVEGAAFEELIGFHGGLGGKQSQPFVLAPTGLAQPTEPLVGARSIHELFKSWVVGTQQTH